MADAPDSKSGVERRVGSSPTFGTSQKKFDKKEKIYYNIYTK